ncbi:homoserine kinase [Pseudaquabacterium pictum]|uniref:Homoserine kinase n=1 Tax=Pseudaquabacterium pictum TaxID=2315236 RepID=A0A480ANA9_9BURK|nr:homoserine kinase [Rubrivivax pictus]GCL61145.1 homoserine kinase [Rubrivivax pictus]
MAVFTDVTPAQAGALTERLGAGTLQRLQGIGAGIENSNFFVTTTQGDWVLTLFERLTAAQLPYYLQLMQHLAQRGLPVPAPRADADGQILHQLAGKPAALVNRLPGHHQLAPGLHHCAQLGSLLARMHLAVADFPLQQPNLRGRDWWPLIAPQVRPHLPPAQQQLLDDELAFQQQVAASPAFAALPQGAVHADLFCDNVLFDGLPGHEKLTGAFDFYFAGTDSFGYDLAVCLNDWCLNADDASLDEARAQALVQAYEVHRPLSAGEHRLLPALLRAAALRFWLSRLGDWHLPRPAALLQPKDPGHFERVLRARIAQPWHAVR